MFKKSSLALIIPCYNESKSITYFASELPQFIHQFRLRLPEFKLAIIIVDNNSTDNSLALLKNLQIEHDCISVEICKTQGYGAALKQGFAANTAEYISFLDMDNTYPMVSLIDLLNKLRAEDLDMILGARIHPNSEISVIRYLGNQLYVLLLKYLLSSQLSDVCSGMRVFKGSLKNEILRLPSNDLSFSIDLTSYVLINKWKVSEHPIPYRDRIGESKLSVIKDGWLFLYVVIKNYFKIKYNITYKNV